MGLGAVCGHVGVPAKGALALILCRLQHGGRISVLEQHVGTTIDQACSGFGFFGWVEPLVDPHHLSLDLGVAALRTQRKAVDIADDFGNWNGCDHTQRAGFGHLAGNNTRHVRAFVGATVVGAQVVGRLVTGSVLKVHALEVRCHLEHGFHVAKGGTENQLVTLAGQVADHTFGIGRLWHVFHHRCLDLVAKFFFQCQAAPVVCKCPAAVAHRANISKSNLQRLSLGRRGGRYWCGRGCHRYRLRFLAAANQYSTGHGRQSCKFQ